VTGVPLGQRKLGERIRTDFGRAKRCAPIISALTKNPPAGTYSPPLKRWWRRLLQPRLLAKCLPCKCGTSSTTAHPPSREGELDHGKGRTFVVLMMRRRASCNNNPKQVLLLVRCCRGSDRHHFQKKIGGTGLGSPISSWRLPRNDAV
jgi:hypothetical protein